MKHLANPLLQSTQKLPLFDSIQPSHIAPAIEMLIEQAKQALEQVVTPDFPAQWLALSATLDAHTERLSSAWNHVNHLNNVMDNAQLRTAYDQVLPTVSEFWTNLGSDTRLYQQYKRINPQELNSEQQQALQNAKRNFVLSGAELTEQAKARYASIEQQLAQLSEKFSQNVLDATNAWHYDANKSQVQGIADDVLTKFAQTAKNAGVNGYRITLQMPDYLPVMQFADDRHLREILYRAYQTRASDQCEEAFKGFDNSQTLVKILQLRSEQAALLGFENYAQLSLATKMAQSPDQVIDFLRDLAQKARPFALRDLEDQKQFAQEHLRIDEPQSWDWPYIAEKLKEHRYKYSEQGVKQYFPLPKVLLGLFELIESLFNVQIKADTAPIWHPDVQFFRVERQNKLLGQFYLDLFARTGKRAGAWMDGVRDRWLRPDTHILQTPIVHLVCNFSAPSATQVSLLTHDDLTTLFHEFGHGLHHLLTQVNERDVAGINGVQWDAVELPSQFMENFCWEYDILSNMSEHIQTKQKLPRELFDKMRNAKNYLSGQQTLRQIEFALFDMLLHKIATTTTGIGQVLQILDNVRHEVSVLTPPAYTRMAHSFNHIFAGGYAAGYYSYKWAEVLSADAYSAFEETMQPNRVINKQTSLKFLNEILQVGGSRDAMQSFIAFRGRNPDPQALLRHQGMI